MNKPLVSIIMPVKNGLPYLPETLDSIVNQTLSNWQLIIVDDHSLDSTWSWLKLNTKDERISYFKNNGNGIIDALETAWQACSGDYVTRMDADDIMPEDKLAKLLTALNNEPENTVATGLVKYFKADDVVNDGYKQYEAWLNSNLLSENPYNQLFKECVIPSPAWMVKREVIMQLGGFKDLEYPEDYDLVFRFKQLGLTIKTIPSVIHFWRDHSTRASRNDPNYAENSFLPLKIKWLLKMHPNTTFNIIGAGKKGKKIAQYLSASKVGFNWFTNNPKKLVVPIYGIELKELKVYKQKNTIWIVAVANKQEQKDIISEFDEQNMVPGTDYLLFC